MKLTNKSEFSRPILRERKFDFNSTINVVYEIETYENKLILKYSINLESENFIDYIKEGNIGVYIHLYSMKIMYRDAYQLDELVGELVLPKGEVYGDLDLSLLLISKKNQKLDLPSELIDKDDNNYLVKKGMIVGFANTRVLEVDYSKTQLEDLVTVIATDDKNRYNRIDIGNNVEYFMSRAEHNAFKELDKDNKPINKQLSKIVYNAIYTRVLTKVVELKNFEDDEDDFFQSNIYEYAHKQFEQFEIHIRDIDFEDVNYYAMQLSEIEFQTIVGEEDGTIR